jgi:hypothetical protein
MICGTSLTWRGKSQSSVLKNIAKVLIAPTAKQMECPPDESVCLDIVCYAPEFSVLSEYDLQRLCDEYSELKGYDRAVERFEVIAPDGKKLIFPKLKSETKYIKLRVADFINFLSSKTNIPITESSIHKKILWWGNIDKTDMNVKTQGQVL